MSNSNGRKMPIRISKFDLDGDFTGWWFNARTNFPMSFVEEMQSQDMDRMAKALSLIIIDWNFVDENGEDLGNPTQEIIKNELPIELVGLITTALVSKVQSVPNE
jgi:hypothetical protein